MEKILYLSVSGTKVKAVNSIDVTAHSRHWFRCSFDFDADWAALTDKVAVFSNDKKTFAAQALSEDGTCFIPDSVLQGAGYLYIGVMHSSFTQEEVWQKLPSEWAAVTVREGVDTGAAPPPPEQSVYDAIKRDSERALAYAADVENRANAGVFTATVTVGTVTTGEPGSQAAVSDSGTAQHGVLDFTIPRGETGFTGPAGPPGPAGVNWRGPYSAGVAYAVRDGVVYNGSSYICVSAGTGHLPTDTAYWSLLAQRGTDGNGAGDMLKYLYDPDQHEADAFSRANHTGTQTAASISDFDTEVGNHSDVAANSSARHSHANGADLDAVSGFNTGNETAASVGLLISGAVAKASPADADKIGLSDSAAADTLKKLSWSDLKAALYIYFSSVYAALASPAFSGTPTAPTAAVGTNTTQIATTAFAQILVPTGTIIVWSTNSAPTGYLLCDGAAVSRATYSALYGVIGTTYGTGDGSTTFNVPNLKGRVPVGRDTSQGEFDVLGETGGAKSHTLTVDQMPAHSHTIIASGDTTPDGGSVAPASEDDASATLSTATGSTGGGSAHNNLQPYIVLNYLIKI